MVQGEYKKKLEEVSTLDIVHCRQEIGCILWLVKYLKWQFFEWHLKYLDIHISRRLILKSQESAILNRVLRISVQRSRCRLRYGGAM